MPLTTPSHYIHNRQPVSGGTVKYWAKSRFRFTPVDGSPYPDTAAADYTATTVADGSWLQGTLPAGDYYVSLEATGLVRSWTGDLIAPSAVASTICMPDGTEALPGWPFCNHLSSGLFWNGNPAVSHLGKAVADFTSSGFGTLFYVNRGTANERYFAVQPVIHNDGSSDRYGIQLNSDNFLWFTGIYDLILGGNAFAGGSLDGWIYLADYGAVPPDAPRFVNAGLKNVPVLFDSADQRLYAHFGTTGGLQYIQFSAMGGGGMPSLALDDLTDVATAGQADGDTIVRTSGIYVPTNFKLRSLKDVPASAPSNGQVPTWDTGLTPAAFSWQTPPGGGSGAPTTAEYVATASDGTLSAEVVIPGLAGSADIAGTYGGGISEEYDSSTTGLTWTPGAPATVDSDTTTKSYLYIAANDATERLGLRSWSPGAGAFTATCELSIGHSVTAGGNFPGGGFIITDSGSNNRVLLNRTYDVTNQRFEALGYTYAGGSYTSRTANVLYAFARYFQITRDGSSNWSWWWSIDGLDWIIMGTFSFSMTVANIGYRVAHQGSGTMTFHSDWLRTSV